ncbi:MAG: hypothetical protein WC712_08070 [Candidatus Brocadiia bacterium]
MNSSSTTNEIRAKLAEFVATHGNAILGDRHKCMSLLAEHLPSHAPEVKTILAALHAGIPQDLISITNRATAIVMMDVLRLKLAGKERISDAQARWAIESWAIALGIIGHSHTEGRANPFADAKPHGVTKPADTHHQAPVTAVTPAPTGPSIQHSRPHDPQSSHHLEPTEEPSNKPFYTPVEIGPPPLSRPIRFVSEGGVKYADPQAIPDTHYPAAKVSAGHDGHPHSPTAPFASHGEFSPEFSDLIASLAKVGKNAAGPVEPDTARPVAAALAGQVAGSVQPSLSAGGDSSMKMQAAVRPMNVPTRTPSTSRHPQYNEAARDVKARTANEDLQVLKFGILTGALTGFLAGLFSPIGYFYFASIVIGATVFSVSAVRYYERRRDLIISKPPIVAWTALGALAAFCIVASDFDAHGLDLVIKRIALAAVIGLVGSLILTRVLFWKKRK